MLPVALCEGIPLISTPPTPPQDAATMLMMMDVSEGDRVLESGSGSGAMSLFLSRAGQSQVVQESYPVTPDHLL